jgi:hypothetical protein
MKLLRTPVFTLMASACILLASSCVTDPGVAKKRGLVSDFSRTDNSVGCDADFLILSDLADTCTPTCATGTHIADATELKTLKEKAEPGLLEKINASAGVCIDDVVKEVRPTNKIDIKSDFCSCINGKSDLISDCASFCSTVPTSPSPVLYLNTIMEPEIALNTKLGNLANWCNVQLDSDATTPQCFLNASDGVTTVANIPITSLSGNSLTANIQGLALDKTYIVKIVEGKSGSNAQSKEFQLRRKTQIADDTSIQGVLKTTPISQYTCMTYGGFVNSTNGQVTRTSYARVFYNFAANETPAPMPPAGGTNQAVVVCHDEQLHPGNDSAEYPRLELIPQLFATWDKSDPRFVNENNTGLVINKTLTTRLANEYGVSANLDLFKPFSAFNRPSSSSTSSVSYSLGFMMVPFVDKAGHAFCPTQVDYNSANQPLFNLLKEYMDDTEGVYIAEKEAETIQDSSSNIFKVVYGTMFITESVVKKYGFYFENGLKIKADQSSMNTRTINYYWPTNDTMDPLTQGNRRLFTVRSPDNLSGGNSPIQPITQRASDKRLGCVPKSTH